MTTTSFSWLHLTDFPGDFSATLESGGRRIGIVGLNTTFLQLAGGNYEGRLVRLSRQSYAILPKIKDVDTVLRQHPQLAERVFEVHPEVCFYFWAERQPMRHPKKTGFGFAERLDLVRTVFGDAAEAIRSEVPRDQAGDDDILDALAALWSARRIHSGVAIRLPEQEERDELGLPMQMLA